MKKTSSLWPYISLLGVPNLANALAVGFLIFFIAPLALAENIMGLVRESHPLVGLYVNLAPFVFVSSLVIVYSLPVFREWPSSSDKSEMTDQAKRRLINAPVYISLLGFLGWVFASLNNIVVLWFIDVEASAWWYVFGTLINFFTGGLTFLVTYYILERINTSVYIELLFPRGDLNELPGLVHVSIRDRFIIYFLSAGFLPTFILAAALYSELSRQTGTATYIPVALFGIFTLLSVFLTIMISRNFQNPLYEMLAAARKIESGHLDVSLRVTSTDEIGELGVGFNRMAAGLREKEKIKEDFGRAVDPRVRDYLLDNQGQLGGEQRVASVLFCDIRGFTALSENREPRQVVEILNRYFEQMNIAVEQYQGVVNKFIGDAVMALFGAPIPDESHAEQAVRSGLEMMYRRDELNVKLKEEGLPVIRTGIGIHSGELLAGNLGSADRQEYTVIGDSVNLAARLEGLCKKLNHEFIISEATRAALPETLAQYFVFLARVRVKGKQEAVAVYGYRVTQSNL